MISVVRCQFGGISNCRLSICSSSPVQVDVGGAGGGAARVQYCKLVCQAGGWRGPYCSHQASHDLTLPGRSPLPWPLTQPHLAAAAYRADCRVSPSQLDQLELRTGHHLLAGPGLRLGDGTQVGGGSWGPYKSCPRVDCMLVFRCWCGAGSRAAPWRPLATTRWAAGTAPGPGPGPSAGPPSNTSTVGHSASTLYNLDIIHSRAGAAPGGAQRAGRLLAGGQGGPAPGHPGLNRWALIGWDTILTSDWSTVHLDCIQDRRRGSPAWEWSHNHKEYPTGIVTFSEPTIPQIFISTQFCYE